MCVIFNGTVDSAGGQALHSRDSSVLTNSKALDRAIFQGHCEFSPQTRELIIIIIITILAKFTTYSAERKREQKILPSLNILDS